MNRSNKNNQMKKSRFRMIRRQQKDGIDLKEEGVRSRKFKWNRIGVGTSRRVRSWSRPTSLPPIYHSSRSLEGRMVSRKPQEFTTPRCSPPGVCIGFGSGPTPMASRTSNPDPNQFVEPVQIQSGQASIPLCPDCEGFSPNKKLK